MKIYNEGYFRVIELPQDKYDLINLYNISKTGKVLLGNDREREYLLKILNISIDELDYADYYMIKSILYINE